MSEPIINAPKSFWHDPAGVPPEVIRRAPGFRVTMSPGIDKFGGTVIARVELSVADRYDRMYGGATRGATTVVAIDLERGGAYARAPYSNHAVPMSGVMQPEAGGGPGERLGKTTMATAFNVDVPWLLELPPTKGRYCLFMWLDETVSDARTIEVEGASKRFSMPAPPARPEKGSAVTFTPGSGVAGNRLLTCEAPPAKWEKRKLNGRIAIELLSGVEPGAKESRKALTIMVLDHLTRKVGSESVLLPEKPAGTVLNFTADIDAIVKRLPDAGRGRVFVVAHIDGNITPVQVFEAPPEGPKPVMPAPATAQRSKA